jgi:hypothetical protein
MSINVDACNSYVFSVLKRNPTLRNSALVGVLKANQIEGHIRIFDSESHFFKSEGINKPAKIIHISPYGFLVNLLISIKRIFTGIIFGPFNHNGTIHSHLAQGRRITSFCALDGSSTEILIEKDQLSLFRRTYNTLTSCCKS